MPHHVVVDGSNLATEGRALPSLAQLHDAVMAFIGEHPDALITVVVDATFGHRIDPREVAEFDDAVANNELVAPPAGAIGRGDAFLLSIANKVGGTVLSNDSFQEFHGVYTWLFDEGRLIGGKPVPHIGWVFVARVPVRGPISRTAVKDARRKKDGLPARVPKHQASAEASLPMPVPKAPPPNATVRGATPPRPASKPRTPQPTAARGGAVTAAPAVAPVTTPATMSATTLATKTVVVNDLMPFLSFVEHHPVGTSVNAMVENYSSHGAYVRLSGDVVGYVPLRMMADPAPRSAREFLKIGDAVTLVVESFAPARRSIDLATVSMASVKAPAPKKPARPSRARAHHNDAQASTVDVKVALSDAKAGKAGKIGKTGKTGKTCKATKSASMADVKATKSASMADVEAAKPASKAAKPASKAAKPARKADVQAGKADVQAGKVVSKSAKKLPEVDKVAPPDVKPVKRGAGKRVAAAPAESPVAVQPPPAAAIAKTRATNKRAAKQTKQVPVVAELPVPSAPVRRPVKKAPPRVMTPAGTAAAAVTATAAAPAASRRGRSSS